MAHVMYMKKYADVDPKDVRVLSPRAHAQIEQNLHKIGKKTLESASPIERKVALDVTE